MTDIKYFENIYAKAHAEVVEDVEKSCETCGLYVNQLCQTLKPCLFYGHVEWQPIEPPMIETADPSKIVKGSEQRKKLESIKNCPTCANGNDSDSAKKCCVCDDEGSMYKAQGVLGCCTLQRTGTTEDAKHYMTGKQQPIEIMQEKMTKDQFIGFLLGNVIKYSLRINHKDNDREDAGKCAQYAEWLCQAMDGKTIIPGGK